MDGSTEATTFHFDLGLIKKFRFAEKKHSNHSINLGASITNLNFAKISFESSGMKDALPVITRYGTNYAFSFKNNRILGTLNTLNVLILWEYQRVLNSDYYSGFHTGSEVSFFEILMVRVGYYKEDRDDYGLPASNKNSLSSFTYGFGLQFPIHKLSEVPLNVNLDYASLPQVSLSKSSNDWSHFSTYTVSLNWLINHSNAK